MRVRGPRGRTPGLARRAVRAHVRAYTLVRAVVARAAARPDVVPRPISFDGAVQAVCAFQPLREPRAARDAAGRWRVCRDLPGAIAAHRVADRPGRYEPRVKGRRRDRDGWLTRPRAEMGRRMAKRIDQK